MNGTYQSLKKMVQVTLFFICSYHAVSRMTCSADKGLENEGEVLTVLEDGY